MYLFHKRRESIMNTKESKTVVVIGAGVLSTTFSSMLKELEPSWNIKLYERLDRPGIESSNERHNAGTGHAALYELNYTVRKPDGSMKDFPMFDNIEYTEDIEEMRKWVPLMMEGHSSSDIMAASKINEGTDVNFGELTRKMAKNIEQHPNANVQYNHEVIDFNHRKDGKWEVKVRQRNSGDVQTELADYVFIGAGGGAIPLLQKTGIPESKNLGGFPITGQFLICTNPDTIAKHDAKVYGKEPKGTPPMTVPHLDTRYIDGERTLLFGPFASVGPKFLKNGSNLDLFKSIKPYNITTLLSSAVKN